MNLSSACRSLSAPRQRARCNPIVGELHEKTHCVHIYITGRCHAGARRTGRRSNRRFYVRWLDLGFWDEAMDLSAAGFDGKDRELVLGRKTYEIFEAYWP